MRGRSSLGRGQRARGGGRRGGWPDAAVHVADEGKEGASEGAAARRVVFVLAFGVVGEGGRGVLGGVGEVGRMEGGGEDSVDRYVRGRCGRVINLCVNLSA